MLSLKSNPDYGRVDIRVTFRLGLPRTRRRKIGHRRRAWHPSLNYGFIRARQLDGTLFEGQRVGSYVLTAYRIGAGWGMVSAKRWPRRTGDPWPPPEPPGLDDIARHNRWLGHFAARDLDEICTCLKQRMPVQIALPIHRGWSQPSSGVIELPKCREAFTENHSIVVEECDERLGLLRFWNNWGSNWGEAGYGYLPFEYARQHIYEAWVAIPERIELPIRKWRFPYTGDCRREANRNCLGHVWARINTWDLSSDVRTGWCFAVVRDGWFEIEDFFIRPDSRQPGTFARLLREVTESAHFFGCRLRFWIPHADVSAKGGNFATVNDVIRAFRLKIRKSEARWAAYCAE
jgi:hypothetical protein